MGKQPKSIRCSICGKRFRGDGAIGRLSKHRSRKHPNAKRKPKKKRTVRLNRDGTRNERALPEIHIHIN